MLSWCRATRGTNCLAAAFITLRIRTDVSEGCWQRVAWQPPTQQRGFAPSLQCRPPSCMQPPTAAFACFLGVDAARPIKNYRAAHL
eukprot:9400665-Pyramimonas_sp.AAC.1